MQQRDTNITRILCVLISSISVFPMYADSESIEIINNTGQNYWIGMFYTTANHTKIVSNTDGSIPHVTKLFPRRRTTLNRLPSRGGYDRDIIVLKQDPASIDKFKTNLGKKPGPAVTRIPLSNKEVWYLNVGALQFVDEATITIDGIKKTG